MNCKNHPEVETVYRCAGCATPFCDGCLIEIQAKKYCAGCKEWVLRGTPVAGEETSIKMVRRNQWIAKCAVAIVVCWLLPLYHIGGYPIYHKYQSPGGFSMPIAGNDRTPLEYTFGFELGTGLLRMKDGGRQFVPGVLMPICALFCLLAVRRQIPWLIVATALAAGTLALGHGLLPFFVFGFDVSHATIGAYLSIVVGAAILLPGLEFLRDIGSKKKKLQE
jgi:hypothetical protein